MKTRSYLKILKKGSISNELELEEAFILERKMRLMLKENPELSESRKQLRAIIKEYENKKWSKDSKISDAQIEVSDLAEKLAEDERKFLAKRKESIKDQLIKLGINQQDLGTILGHSKSYISELMNGVNPFHLKDLIIIYNLFKIPLEKLIPTNISQKESERINETIKKINKPKMKLANKSFELSENC